MHRQQRLIELYPVLQPILYLSFERVVDLEAGIAKTPDCGAGHSRKRLKMCEYTYRQERGIGDNSVGRG